VRAVPANEVRRFRPFELLQHLRGAVSAKPEVDNAPSGRAQRSGVGQRFVIIQPDPKRERASQ
jgi:hypothetical protein